MKKVILLTVVLLGISTYLYAFVAKDSVETGKKVICEYEKNSTCYLGKQEMRDAKAGSSENTVELPSSHVGFIESTYYYIPSNSNPNIGEGVIDGLLQQNPTNPNEVYLYTYSTSLTYSNYANWAAELTSRGITPPAL